MVKEVFHGEEWNQIDFLIENSREVYRKLANYLVMCFL